MQFLPSVEYQHDYDNITTPQLGFYFAAVPFYVIVAAAYIISLPQFLFYVAAVNLVWF